MDLIPIFLKEMEREAKTTKKFLALIPEDKFDWRPHPKSTTMKLLSVHIAELPEWVVKALTTEGLDFEVNRYVPTIVNSAQDIVDLHESSLAKARKVLVPENESILNDIWTLKMGEQIFSQETKAETVRHAFNQITHHRAQLGVYFRLLGINLPASYGPSADDMNF
jgi:uncharacterized damage-inducible protein DinB